MKYWKSALLALSFAVAHSVVAKTPEETLSECRLRLRAELRPPLPGGKIIQVFNSIIKNPFEARRLGRDFELIKFKALRERPESLLLRDLKRMRQPEHLLDEVQYMGYVNFFGSAKGNGTFKSISRMIPYMIKELGATMFYALPFLQSPFGDAGFDVSDYMLVDSRFGGDAQFAEFKKMLAQHDGTFQMDLALNHVSRMHKWAIKARQGDPYYRAFFKIQDTPPVLDGPVELNPAGLPMAATYIENGRSIRRRVIFPHSANPKHPHYTLDYDDNGKPMYVFHKFYPFQWDLNFENPNVIREVLKIAAHWANQGVDLFRLDAIPHLFKDKESDPRTLQVIDVLRMLLGQVSPSSSMLSEANQSPEDVLKFFGQPENIYVDHFGKGFATTSRTQMAYNFNQNLYSMTSFLTQKKEYFYKGLELSEGLPPGAVWGNFLRNHDEFTLEKAEPDVAEIIARELIDTGKGLAFRGRKGVSGRLANFLDRNPLRVKLAFSTLFTLKGMPILYYGDEIMAENDLAYAEQAAIDRGGDYDSRDANRGPLDPELVQRAIRSGYSTPQGFVYHSVQRMIKVRKERVSLRRGTTTVVGNNSENVVSYMRAFGAEKTLAIHNLSSEPRTVRLQLPPPGSPLMDLITQSPVKYTVRGGELEIHLNGYDTFWFAF